MDFITHLPNSAGKTVIWVLVDRLSKFAHFISLPPKYTSSYLASIFLTDIYKIHGLPKSIVSDRDPVFLSHFWKQLFTHCGTTLTFSSSYHPQTDGQTEVVNRTLESYLRCFTNDEPKLWSRYLPLAQYWYNTSYHTAIQMTPYQALFGRPAPTTPTYRSGSSSNHSIDSTLTSREDMLQTIKATLQATRQRMEHQANKKRQDMEFQPGDYVYVKLQAYRQSTVAQRGCQKLARRFFGPFLILRRISKVAYHLELPASARIHPIFHVSLLRPCFGDPRSHP